VSAVWTCLSCPAGRAAARRFRPRAALRLGRWRVPLLDDAPLDPPYRARVTRCCGSSTPRLRGRAGRWPAARPAGRRSRPPGLADPARGGTDTGRCVARRDRRVDPVPQRPAPDQPGRADSPASGIRHRGVATCGRLRYGQAWGQSGASDQTRNTFRTPRPWTRSTATNECMTERAVSIGAAAFRKPEDWRPPSGAPTTGRPMSARRVSGSRVGVRPTSILIHSETHTAPQKPAP
jgi:hypothetical protein